MTSPTPQQPPEGEKKTVPLGSFSIDDIKADEFKNKADPLTHKINAISKIILDKLVKNGDEQAEEISTYLYQGQLRHGAKFTLHESAEANERQLEDMDDPDEQQHLKRAISLTRAVHYLAAEAVFLYEAEDDTEIDWMVDEAGTAVNDLNFVTGLSIPTIRTLGRVHERLVEGFLEQDDKDD